MKKRAFTLVELLVVIAIIAMLTSIVLVSLRGVRAKGRDARRMSDIRQISTAMELAYEDGGADCGGAGAYPATGTVGSQITINTISQICPATGNYLKPIPDDPIPGQHYYWMGNNGDCTVPDPDISSGQWYCIYAHLETEDAYIVASQRGVRKLNAAPTNCLCE